MRIQDIITSAKYSELNSIALKDQNAVIISFINFGLIELYKIFKLKTKILTVTPLNTDPIDVPENFMYFLEAYRIKTINNENHKINIIINDTNYKEYLALQDFTSFKVSDSLINKEIFAEYKVNPPKYDVSQLNEDIALPDTLIDCLMHYIAYKGHLSIRGGADSENNIHYQRFVRSVTNVTNLGIAPLTESYEMPNRLADRGFV